MRIVLLLYGVMSVDEVCHKPLDYCFQRKSLVI